MTLEETMAALEKLGSPQTRRIYAAHGASGACFGVKIGDLKSVAKKVPKEKEARQRLALALYRTGNLDAMYLAGLLADGAAMDRKTLEAWAKSARCPMISEYTVPWVASESPLARELALSWIDSKEESIAAAGWNTWSGIVSMRPDEQLDRKEIERLLRRVVKELPKAPNRVRYCMNGFVIAAGAGVASLLDAAKAAARAIGTVEVDMAGTGCKVPDALAMLGKIESMGRVGRKRKTMKC